MVTWVTKKPQTNKLMSYYKKAHGRNSLGIITTRHRGGGWKTLFKRVDYSRYLWNVPAYVKSIEKSRHHTCYLALIVYSIGIVSYIIAPENLRVGSLVIAGPNSPKFSGCTSLIKFIPLNIKIHNIESFPGSGGKYIRSAGSWAKILEKKKISATVLFHNGTKKELSLYCSATIGQVSNSLHKHFQLYRNAGSKRRRGFRPKVRGVAMNPVDHPHGGGEGKKSPPSSNYNFIRRLPKGRKTAKNFRVL